MNANGRLFSARRHSIPHLCSARTSTSDAILSDLPSAAICHAATKRNGIPVESPTSTAVPPPSASDGAGRHHKTGGITFGAAGTEGSTAAGAAQAVQGRSRAITLLLLLLLLLPRPSSPLCPPLLRDAAARRRSRPGRAPAGPQARHKGAGRTFPSGAPFWRLTDALGFPPAEGSGSQPREPAGAAKWVTLRCGPAAHGAGQPRSQHGPAAALTRRPRIKSRAAASAAALYPQRPL